MRQLARACQVLLGLAGVDDVAALWSEHGPSRRASWLKGYLRRSAGPTGSQPRAGRAALSGRGGVRAHAARGKGSRSPVESLSQRERAMLLITFDLWNGSGDILFRDVLALSPRLVVAVAGLMEARCLDSGEAMDAWIARWTPS